MENALQEPQTIVLLGGTSDIGRAIVDELLSPGRPAPSCWPAADPTRRSPSGFVRDPVSTSWSSTSTPRDTASHEPFVERLAAEHGDLDVVIVAFGRSATQADFDTDPQAAAEAVHVNFTGAVSSTLAVAAQMRRQGHGAHRRAVVSVAGERVAASNFVYGSSKAGLDALRPGPRRLAGRHRACG